jgi:POT family proton-dependent oligopeptide transporter
VPWFQSINSIFSIASVPLLFWIWRQQALRGREPNELAKIGTGAFLAAASNLIPVAAIFLSGASPVHPLWPFLYSAGLGISFLYYWPTLLALVSRAAPAKMNATLMGLAFMSLFLANTLVGWIGGFYEKMTLHSFGPCTRPSPPAAVFLSCYSVVASVVCSTPSSNRVPIELLN